MDFTTYINATSLILIPALYVVGMIAKGTEKVSDKYIPVVLLVVGVAGSVGMGGINVNSVIQGVLVTGTAVYTNQLIKQVTKTDETNTK